MAKSAAHRKQPKLGPEQEFVGNAFKESLPDDTAPVASNAIHPKSGEKVTVACKLPSGLILQVFEMREEYEQTLSGPRKIEMGRPREKNGEQIQVKLFGNRWPTGTQPPCRIIGGYALTPNVDKEFFDLWLKQHSDSPMVQNKLVFAMPNNDHAAGLSKELKATRSGLEALDPSRVRVPGTDRTTPKDPRWPRGRRNLGRPSTFEEEDLSAEA